MKPREIIAGILAEIPRTSRSGRWFERVTDEQRGLVDIIRRAWVAGDLGHSARAVAPSIAKRFQAAGVQVTPATVREWLSELRRS